MQGMKSRQRLERLHAHPAFPAAQRIIERLNEAGHSAVFAGGCVRDALLGLAPKDLDIATAAPPEVVEASFAHTLAVGKAFGTIVVVEDGHNFEVTTFRKEGPYHDGRRPSSVHFTDIEEDARRRDFTVNALFYELQDFAILDYTGGLKDLEARVLRTVGVAEERFTEDRLRMLRAIRFVAQLGFALDQEAAAAIRRLGPSLKSVSAERILAEVRRWLTSSFVTDGLKALQATGLGDHFWPEAMGVDPHQVDVFPEFNSWENAFSAIMLLAEARSQEERLREWKASRESLRRVMEQTNSIRRLLAEDTLLAERLRILGSDYFADILILASGLLSLRGERARMEKWIQDYLDVAGTDGVLPKPFLTGQDLIRLGVAPGEKMGALIKDVYDAQLEGRIQSKAAAEEWVRRSLS